MSHELAYNARTVPPRDVARSFIPPVSHFEGLAAPNHTLLLGPRGSGKTTLLKMLTLRALRNWHHPKAITLIGSIRFNAAFIPADVAWGKQIESLDGSSVAGKRKEAAFVLHALRALVSAMREAVDLGRSDCPAHLMHFAVNMTTPQEISFIKLVSASLNLRPVLETLLGLELAFDAMLDGISSGGSGEGYSTESFQSKLSLIISAFNGVTNDEDRRWALLFDELEIAPTTIKNFLLTAIRSLDQRILIKLAMAPYMEDAGFERTPGAAQPLHDYHTVQLTYPNKEDAAEFSSELFRSAFLRMGSGEVDLEKLFDGPTDALGFGRKPHETARKVRIPAEFRSLAQKDESFCNFVNERNIFSKTYIQNENNIARDVRKVLPIVIARDFYLRRFKDGESVANRSRKSHELYTGFPSVMEITEGNPRAILTLAAPLAHELRMGQADMTFRKTISSAAQSSAIRRVELLLTSLLQVIPLELGGFHAEKGLLDFVDRIGRALEFRLLRAAFTPDYVGTFVLDKNAEPSVYGALGRALNAGAVIHVPFPGAHADNLLRGLGGQRFRISYALAPRYRLLLTLGDRVNLSRLLGTTPPSPDSSQQQSLFRDDAFDDNQ